MSHALLENSDFSVVKPEGAKPRLILASASPRRLDLLRQIGIEPDLLLPADTDETPGRTELPHELARRLAQAKAEVARRAAAGQGVLPGAYILAADTVVGVGRRILPKAEEQNQARACLDLLSGRSHRVFTGICLIDPVGKVRMRVVETRVRFKRLSQIEQSAYLAAGEWRGKAGGYAIQGLAGAFAMTITGSYSNVVGLPLYETSILLDGAGFPVRTAWGR